MSLGRGPAGERFDFPVCAWWCGGSLSWSRRELWSKLLAARSLMRIWRPRTPYGYLPSPRGLPVEVNRQDTQPANQIAGSPESEVLEPTGQLDVGESGEQVPKGNLSLKAGKRRSEAKVNTVAESDVVRTRVGPR